VTDAGATLIESIRQGLPPGVELDEREEALLDLAARQAGDVAALEADIAERGIRVEGSRGQPVLNPAVSEARQGRLALGKLLGQLDLPESTADVVRNARHAADTRWRKAG
jgi:uncharacterized protein with von Willebrand factor type A (vWA) domain